VTFADIVSALTLIHEEKVEPKVVHVRSTGNCLTNCIDQSVIRSDQNEEQQVNATFLSNDETFVVAGQLEPSFAVTVDR
jgi:hypothetical protein